MHCLQHTIKMPLNLGVEAENLHLLFDSCILLQIQLIHTFLQPLYPKSQNALPSFTVVPKITERLAFLHRCTQNHRMPCLPSRFHIMTKPCASQEANKLSSQLKQTSSTGAECPNSLLTQDLLSFVTSKKYTHRSSLPETERRDKA